MSSQPARVDRPSLLAARAIAAAFWNWTVILLVVLTAGFTYLVHQLPASQDPTGAIFGVAGTLVALVAPAAALAGQYFEARLNYWAGRVSDEKLGPDVETLATEFTNQLIEIGRPLWRSLVYMAASLVFSLLALLRVPGEVDHVELWQVSAAAAAALILVATAFMMPFSWQIFELRLAEEFKSKALAAAATKR